MEKRISMLGGFSVLQNTILGPGLLGLPWAFAQCGEGLGAILLIFSALTGFAGMHLLCASAVLVSDKRQSNKDLTVAAMCTHAHNPTFGRCVHVAYDLGLVLAVGGALISSLMIIGESLDPLSSLTKVEWILIVWCAAAFPLSWFKKIAFLRYSSLVSFVMVIYVTVVVVVYTGMDNFPAAKEGERDAFRFDNGLAVLQAVPVFTFCFCGHMNIPPIADELDNPTLQRLDGVILSALFAAAAVYGSVCLGAYISFGNLTPQDLLKNYDPSPSITVARIGMAVVCTAFYPLLVQPVRAVFMGWAEACARHRKMNRDVAVSLQTQPLRESHGSSWSSGSWIAGGAGGNDGEEASDAERPKKKCSTRCMAYCMFTLMIGGATLGVAVSVDSLGKVFSLSGASGFALVCNICPAFLYLAVAPPGEMSGTRVLAVLLGFFGILMMPVCITANLVN